MLYPCFCAVLVRKVDYRLCNITAHVQSFLNPHPLQCQYCQCFHYRHEASAHWQSDLSKVQNKKIETKLALLQLYLKWFKRMALSDQCFYLYSFIQLSVALFMFSKQTVTFRVGCKFVLGYSFRNWSSGQVISMYSSKDCHPRLLVWMETITILAPFYFYFVYLSNTRPSR